MFLVVGLMTNEPGTRPRRETRSWWWLSGVHRLGGQISARPVKCTQAVPLVERSIAIVRMAVASALIANLATEARAENTGVTILAK